MSHIYNSPICENSKGLKLLTIFTEFCIVEVWQGLRYVYALSETYSGLCQTSMGELFDKIVNSSALVCSTGIENYITITIIPVGQVTFKTAEQYECDFVYGKCFRILLQILKLKKASETLTQYGNVD